jgi:hypothetical protein
MKPEDILTPEQLAERLQVKRSWVYILVRELKTIDVQVRNADSFFRDAEWHAEVDQMALYELMEMDGNKRRGWWKKPMPDST